MEVFLTLDLVEGIQNCCYCPCGVLEPKDSARERGIGERIICNVFKTTKCLPGKVWVELVHWSLIQTCTEIAHVRSRCPEEHVLSALSRFTLTEHAVYSEVFVLADSYSRGVFETPLELCTSQDGVVISRAVTSERI